MNKPTISTNSACDDTCPVAVAADVLDGKWTTLIIRELLPGTRRYSELMRGLPGISPKMLAARLTMLMEHDIITKTIYPCVPPKTEYTLTPLGRELENLINAMAQFGITLQNAQAPNA